MKDGCCQPLHSVLMDLTGQIPHSHNPNPESANHAYLQDLYTAKLNNGNER